MPIYEYRRPDGTTFEVQQSFSEDPLTRDPKTGVSVTRVLHAPALHFKGSGFYNTDYGTRQRQRELASAAEGSSAESKDLSGDSSSPDSSSSDSASSDSSASKDGAGGSTASDGQGKAKTEPRANGSAKSKPARPAPAKG
jgi:putative FmdB family regulatory protein